MFLVVDSDEIFGECVISNLEKNGFSGHLSSNAISAINFVAEVGVPKMVFLDVMLTGPDGFTFINELMSYEDTMKVPIVILSEKDFSSFDLSEYNVVGFLNKNTLKPEEVIFYAKQYA